MQHKLSCALMLLCLIELNGLAHADTCLDIRRVYNASKGDFPGWRGNYDADTDSYVSKFQLTTNGECTISKNENATDYSCGWRLSSFSEMRDVYEKTIQEVRECKPLIQKAPRVETLNSPEKKIGGYIHAASSGKIFYYPDAKATVHIYTSQSTRLINNLTRYRVNFILSKELDD